MSRKHFRRMADNLKRLRPDATDSHVMTFIDKLNLWRELVGSVADVCAESNPNFDRSRFFTACGDEDNEGGG